MLLESRGSAAARLLDRIFYRSLSKKSTNRGAPRERGLKALSISPMIQRTETIGAHRADQVLGGWCEGVCVIFYLLNRRPQRFSK